MTSYSLWSSNGSVLASLAVVFALFGTRITWLWLQLHREHAGIAEQVELGPVPVPTEWQPLNGYIWSGSH